VRDKFNNLTTNLAPWIDIAAISWICYLVSQGHFGD